jgi:uncharacterized protein (TIGR02145 family)
MKILIGLIVLIMMATSSFAGDCKWDIDGSGTLNLLDVSYTINYLYRHGPAPDCGPSITGVCGDVNDDDKLNLLDVSATINHLYRGSPESICGSFTDIDGNVYKTVMIGTQVWMAENLKVTHYRNGEEIPNVTGPTIWQALTTGAYCENVTPYGSLYNWFAAVDNRNIAPAGWHVPSDAEWKQLEMYLGMSQAQADAEGWRDTTAGGKMKEVGTTHWAGSNEGATNESGFSGLPGGYRNYGGPCYDIGYYAYFWSSTESSSTFAWYRTLYYDISGVARSNYYKQGGFSVRCVRGDMPVLTTTSVSAITQTTAECGGTIISDGGATIMVSGVCWSTNATPTINDSKTTDGTGMGSFTSSITDLTESTTYYVRAYATNSIGTGYGNTSSFATMGKVMDIDGNWYQTIKIGDQWWMAENLKVTHYRNGDAIPNVTDSTEWSGLTTGAYCEYNNDINNVAAYGRLYNWYSVNDSRNIAPAGWHVPTDAEWKQLEMYLGMSQAEADAVDWRGNDEGGKLKEAGTTHWNSPNTGATNESGFSGLPGGYRIFNSNYYDVGNLALFWSSTEYGSYPAWTRYLGYYDSEVGRSYDSKQDGFSVRCVRDY